MKPESKTSRKIPTIRGCACELKERIGVTEEQLGRVVRGKNDVKKRFRNIPTLHQGGQSCSVVLSIVGIASILLRLPSQPGTCPADAAPELWSHRPLPDPFKIYLRLE